MTDITINRQTLYLAIAFIALFAFSNILLITKFLKLKKELNDANVMISKLENSGTLREADIGKITTPPYKMGVYNLIPASVKITSSVSRSHKINEITINQILLSDIKSQLVKELSQPNTKYTLFVFLSPTDCPVCTQESLYWQKLFDDGQQLDLTVIGIITHSSATELETFIKDLGVTFPVIYDKQSYLKKRYKIMQTPEKVLLDANGSIIFRSHPNKTLQDQIDFYSKTRKSIKP